MTNTQLQTRIWMSLYNPDPINQSHLFFNLLKQQAILQIRQILSYGKVYINTSDTHWSVWHREDNHFSFGFLVLDSCSLGSPESDYVLETKTYQRLQPSEPVTYHILSGSLVCMLNVWFLGVKDRWRITWMWWIHAYLKTWDFAGDSIAQAFLFFLFLSQWSPIPWYWQFQLR